MKLEQQLLTYREWSQNNNYWSTGNEFRTTIIDQQGMKLEQQPLINREWNNNYCEVRTITIDQREWS